MTEENNERERESLGEPPEEQIRVWGFGVLLNSQKKIYEELLKIQKLLYFLEKRQQEWFELTKSKQ